ncbi:MAG: SRPBCC family protein [Myxococcota bacterium]
MQLTSRAELLPKETIAQLCGRGMVALIESYPDGRSRQVVLFARFPGPPEPIYDALMNVEAYPKYLNTIDTIDIIGRRNGLTAFSWTLDLPLFALSGTRMQRGLRPHTVESKGRTGHLRGSRERWELFEVKGGTLVAFYRALDVETGGFLLRTLVDLEPSTEAGANLSSGFIHLRGLENHLAGRPATRQLPEARTGPVHALVPLDLAKDEGLTVLQPLLAHGQLAVIESFDDGALRQVALIGAAKASAKRLHHVVSDAERYPEFMPNISHQKVTPHPGGGRQLAWTIKTPVSSMSGKALMTVGPSTVDVNATEGDVERARIHWRFVPTGEDRAIALYYTYSDIRSASWVTRRLLNAEPLLEHGMVAAAGMVALSAMTARAEGRR